MRALGSCDELAFSRRVHSAALPTPQVYVDPKSERLDSNQRPLGPRPSALPLRHVPDVYGNEEEGGGFEPPGRVSPSPLAPARNRPLCQPSVEPQVTGDRLQGTASKPDPLMHVSRDAR